jgi:hypothetical protein
VFAASTGGCGGSPVGPSGQGRSSSFTVMTFNIQHGLDFAGRYNFRRPST